MNGGGEKNKYLNSDNSVFVLEKKGRWSTSFKKQRLPCHKGHLPTRIEKETPAKLGHQKKIVTLGNPFLE